MSVAARYEPAVDSPKTCWGIWFCVWAREVFKFFPRNKKFKALTSKSLLHVCLNWETQRTNQFLWFKKKNRKWQNYLEMENRFMAVRDWRWWRGRGCGSDYKGAARGRSMWWCNSSVSWFQWWLHTWQNCTELDTYTVPMSFSCLGHYMIVMQDVTVDGNWIKGTWDLSLLLLHLPTNVWLYQFINC